MTISLLQSNYIPWKGYFDIIAKSDVFVIYDDVQYTKNDWRNRNLIKSNDGLVWLTIPIQKGKLNKKIYQVTVSKKNWAKKHKATLQTIYGKAPFFKKYKKDFFEIYDTPTINLSEINRLFIEKICYILGIETKIIDSRELQLNGNKNERILDACLKLNATSYLSGPSAKNYIDEDLFSKNNIKIEWMDYANYSEYSQSRAPFDHGVSILDLIFNEGVNARNFLKHLKNGNTHNIISATFAPTDIISTDYLEWDSTFFNKKIGVLDLGSTILKCDQLEDYDLVYVFSEKEIDFQIANFKESYSGSKVVFSKQIQQVKDFQEDTNILVINESQAKNEIYDLAFESGKFSRFKLDSNFTKAEFEKIYSIWIDNSYTKEIVDVVLEFKPKDKSIGFVTYKTYDEFAVVSLIAIDPLQQGKGIGRKLLEKVENDLALKNIKEIRITTQLQNVAACGFYHKLGYQIIEEKYVKHFWKL